MATYKPLLPTAADKERGLTQGLLQLGQSLSASGGYSKMPTSFLSALGQGGAAFGQGYQSEIDRAKKGQVQNLQYQQAQAQMEQTQMNIDAAKRKQAQEAQAQLVADRYVNSRTMGGNAAGGQMGPTVGAGSAHTAMGGTSQGAMMQADSLGYLQSAETARLASEADKLKHQQAIQLEKIKSSGQGGLKQKDIIQLESGASKDAQSALKNELAKLQTYKALEATQANPAAAAQQFSQGAMIDGVPINAAQISASGQGAADLALIFGFMKMLDPTSVVRESEFSMAAQTGGVPTYLKSMLSKVASGDVLTGAERGKLLGQARNQYDSADLAVQTRLASERKRFGSYDYPGLDADRAFANIYTPYTPRIARSVYGAPPAATPAPMLTSSAMSPSEKAELEALRKKHPRSN